MNFGWGAVGGGRKTASGTVSLRGAPDRMGITGHHAAALIRERIAVEKPDAVGYASMFIATRGRDGKPIPPNSIGHLFSIQTLIDMECWDFKNDCALIPCYEVAESEARKAFMQHVPRKSKDIKAAVMAACEQRRWPFPDDHAADALCVASFIFDELVSVDEKHLTTPLFLNGKKRP